MRGRNDKLIHVVSLAGEITASELGSVMRQLGLKPSDTELDDLMNEIDTDRSGTISFEGNVESFSLPPFSIYQEKAPFNILSNIDYASCFRCRKRLKFIPTGVVSSPGITIVVIHPVLPY